MICLESSVPLIKDRGIKINFEILKDILIPANASSVQISEYCSILLYKTLAQPRILKVRHGRKFQGFVSSYDYTYRRDLYTYSSIPIFDINTTDKAFFKITCVHPDKPASPVKAQFIKEQLAQNGLIKCDIGESELCTKPIEANLVDVLEINKNNSTGTSNDKSFNGNIIKENESSTKVIRSRSVGV